MDVVRTPDERFADLPDFPYAPDYAETADGLRAGFIDEGPRTGRWPSSSTESPPGRSSTGR